MKKYSMLALIFILSLFSLSVSAVEAMHSLEYHGYFRSSLGFSEGNQTQAKFQLPGARSKYRLGNEPDTNMELQFDYRYQLKDPENKDAHIQSVIMLDGFKNQGSSNNFTVGHLSQAYLSFNKMASDEVDVWIGRRYYQRKSIHIMNHFWLNPGQNSHSGVGFEGLSLGAGKLDLALFRNEDNFTVGLTDYLINSTVMDARWHDLNVTNNSKLTVWGQLADRTAVAALGYEKKSGHSFGGWLDYKSGNLKNTTFMMLQKGAAITQSGTNPRAIREDLTGGWNLDKANVFEVSNMLTYEKLTDYSFQWSLLYRHDDHGTGANSDIDWMSTGIRPVFYLSKHLNFALEAGIDHVKDKVNNRSGSLKKLTLALQLAADRGFKSRPVLRFFLTMAQWDDAFKGLVGDIPGNAPYANAVSGWTVGAQAETWW